MTLSRRTFLSASAAAALGCASRLTAADPKPRKLVLIAGTPSHPPGMHEFNAGVRLIEKCLAGVKGLETVALLNGYPKDDSVLDTADAILCYADGGGRHPLILQQRLQRIGALVKKGVGLMCAHYGVEVPKDLGGPEFKDWIGGYYENAYSCNPIWTPEFKSFPDHPIARGVKPFSIKDEWYFHMRFRDDAKGVTPILVATPPDQVRDGPYVSPKGPYKHIQEDKGKPETMMWAYDRPDGGRGVGFTGGHFHTNWGDPNFRKVVLNALLWISKVEVPADGVESALTEDDLKQNLDPKGKKK
jgi:type 1 glutamine amidotransferase